MAHSENCAIGNGIVIYWTIISRLLKSFSYAFMELCTAQRNSFKYIWQANITRLLHLACTHPKVIRIPCVLATSNWGWTNLTESGEWVDREGRAAVKEACGLFFSHTGCLLWQEDQTARWRATTARGHKQKVGIRASARPREARRLRGRVWIIQTTPALSSGGNRDWKDHKESWIWWGLLSSFNTDAVCVTCSNVVIMSNNVCFMR